MLQQNAKTCPGFSAIWLIVVNVIYFIFGVAFMSLAGWGIDQHSKASQNGGATGFLPYQALQVLVAAGVFLVVLAFVGCLGVFYNAKAGGRYLLGFYAFFMILVMILEFAASLAVLSFTGKLEKTVVNSDSMNQINGDYGTFQLVNMSFFACCCGPRKCPNLALNMTRNYCWVPRTEPYPCDDINDFGNFLKTYIDARIEPVAGLALFLCLLQFFTSVVACCNQCQGKKQQEKDKIAGAMSYDGMDGMYGDQEAGAPSFAAAGADGAYGKWAGQGGRPGSASVVQPPPPVAARAPGPPKRPNLGPAPGAAGGAQPTAGPKL